MRGTFYLLECEHNEAKEDLDFVIDNANASKELKVNALVKRATIFLQMEDLDNTFGDFEKAMQIDPDCSDIYQNRGQV